MSWKNLLAGQHIFICVLNFLFRSHSLTHSLLSTRLDGLAHLVFTVYSLQLIVPEVERDQFGPGAQAELWRPLQAIVGQDQGLQLTQGL